MLVGPAYVLTSSRRDHLNPKPYSADRRKMMHDPVTGSCMPGTSVLLGLDAPMKAGPGGLLQNKGHLHIDPKRGDFSVLDVYLLFLNPSALDVVYRFTRFRQSLGNSIFEAFLGYGTNFDCFSNTHAFLLRMCAPPTCRFVVKRPGRTGRVQLLARAHPILKPRRIVA